MPADLIQSVIRSRYDHFRRCYEQGLVINPKLEGRVVVRFQIELDGAVSYVSDAGSDIPDPDVVQCVIHEYYGLSFPQPNGDTVKVVYPIAFSPEP